MITLQVLTTMKMKEVQDLCQSDPRFNALKSGGEKKQALAEYQVRRPSFIPYSLSLHLPIHSYIVYPIFLSFFSTSHPTPAPHLSSRSLLLIISILTVTSSFSSSSLTTYSF